MFTIEEGSEAWQELASVFDPEQAVGSFSKISIEERANGVAIKMGEHMWSPTLRTTSR